MASGVLEAQTAALLNIRVTGSGAQSNRRIAVSNNLESQKKQKKMLHAAEAAKRRATFTPFVVTVDGAFGKEAQGFLRAVARRLCVKWCLHFIAVMS